MTELEDVAEMRPEEAATGIDEKEEELKAPKQLCRLCGTEAATSHNIFDEPELADRIRISFSTVVSSNKSYPMYANWVTSWFDCQIYPDDSLPQSICDECHSAVNAFHAKITQFQKIERNWLNELRAHNPAHYFLKAVKVFKVNLKAASLRFQKAHSHLQHNTYVISS